MLQNIFTRCTISHNIIHKCCTSVIRFDNRFCSVDNSTKELNRSHLGSNSFIRVATSPNFVDKSLFIESFLDCEAQYLLITAPRRFGKSINLDMLRTFFHSEEYKEIFLQMKIGQTSSMKFCGKMPVVWLNLKHGVDYIDSIDATVEACRISICEAFRKNRYLITSKKLDEHDVELCKLWCMHSKSLDRSDIRQGLQHLVEFVSIHHERKCLLLVDEFDAICSSAFSRVESTLLSNIIDFYSSIIGNVIKSDDQFVDRAVLTGITRIMSAGMSNPMNNVISYPFLSRPDFVDFYGILEDEFDELLSRPCNSSVRHLKEDALKFYNGYSFRKKNLLNTWSVMNFLNDETVRPFWVESGVQELKLSTVCRNEVVRRVAIELTRGNSIESSVYQFDAKNFKQFYDDIQKPELTMSNCDPLLNFYLQQGYLNIVDFTYEEMTLRIPNEEIRTLFVNGLVEYFEATLGIDQKLLKSSVKYFMKLSIQNDTACLETLKSIRENLENMCNEGIYRNRIFMNEALLQHLVFSLLYISGFEPTVEIRVKQAGRKYKRYDSCAVRKNHAIVIEFERNNTAKGALEKILDKDYFEAIEQRIQFSGQVTDYLLLGINVETNEDSHMNYITMCYLRNSKDIKNNIRIIS